jgi:pimeloyl-ACP methyl ester carboxylesterase
VNVNGDNIRYKEFGERENRHILFIHGLGSSSDRWLDIPEALSRYHHAIALDLPGFGGSDAPQMEYTINRFREFVLDFMRALGIDDDKITLIGHSLGGYIAAEIAIQNRNCVNKLVLIDSSGMLKKPTALLEEYLDAATSASPDKVKRVFEQLAAQKWRVLPIVVEMFNKRLKEVPGAKHAFESAYRNSTSTQIGLDRLKQIEGLPTLIIWGRNDTLIPVEHSKLFKQAIQNAYLEIIEDAGHAPFVEKPAIVCEILREFLT